MTELELIIDLHQNTERQGPGSEEDTLNALACVHLPQDQELNIADLGCGTGAQTFSLAKKLNASITAVDLFPEFLNVLQQKAQASGLSRKIRTLQKSMDVLPFKKEELDLIWSEGAIYNMGFEKGMKQWKDFLKVGGYLAVSEITWITPSRPKEIEDFWKAEYPEVDTASRKISQLENNGYALTGYFYLSPESWMDHYYTPLQANFEGFLRRHHHAPLAKKVVEAHRMEIELYQKYKEYYSYGFYIAKKTG